MGDMNNSRLWAHDFRYYDQLRAMVDMNEFELWAQDSICNE